MQNIGNVLATFMKDSESNTVALNLEDSFGQHPKLLSHNNITRLWRKLKELALKHMSIW